MKSEIVTGAAAGLGAGVAAKFDAEGYRAGVHRRWHVRPVL